MITVRSARFVVEVDGQEIAFEYDENGESRGIFGYQRNGFGEQSPVNASEVRLSVSINEKICDLLGELEKFEHPAVVSYQESS